MNHTNYVWKNYLDQSYDSVLLHAKPYKSSLQTTASIAKILLHNYQKENIRLLELGCGTGNFQDELLNVTRDFTTKTFTIAGIDKTDIALIRAKDKLGNKVTLLKGDITRERLGLGKSIYNKMFKKKYDLVFMVHAFYTLSECEKEILLNEVKKIISKNGYLIINDPYIKPRISNIMFDHIKKTGFFSALKTLLFKQKLQNLKTIIHTNKKYLTKYIFLNTVQQQALLSKHGFKIKVFFDKLYAGNNTLNVYGLQ